MNAEFILRLNGVYILAIWEQWLRNKIHNFIFKYIFLSQYKLKLKKVAEFVISVILITIYIKSIILVHHSIESSTVGRFTSLLTRKCTTFRIESEKCTEYKQSTSNLTYIYCFIITCTFREMSLFSNAWNSFILNSINMYTVYRLLTERDTSVNL